MAQDIRKLLQENKANDPKPEKGHSARFEAKLEAAFSPENLKVSEKKNTTFLWLKIAAVAIIFITVGAFGYYSLIENKNNPNLTEVPLEKGVNTNNTRLGDISPDLKKVEDYYMTGINLQLASLQITKDNKDIIDGYMEQLAQLDDAYNQLNNELSEMGPSEATITAMIDNLKLRLELLFKLKNKLKELKNENNDQFETI